MDADATHHNARREAFRPAVAGYVHFANFSRKQSGISMGPFG